MGASASFVESSSDSLALFGAPGCFTWRGNVFGQRVGTLNRYDVAVDRSTASRFSKHGHMGLSVASGRFFGGRVYYASGAPHAAATLSDAEDRSGGGGEDRTGEIYFFRRDEANHR